MTVTNFPSHARVVIIGGGVIGTSVAYHLAHAGCTDVVLLEAHKLTAGTTWHSAGLMVTFGSTSETSTELRKYTRDLYARLEAETGQATGLAQVGFIEVASDAGRLEEYRRVSAFNRLMGIDVHEISPQEVLDLFPLAKVDDVLAGFYVKEDGRVNPVDVTMALGKGARMKGVRIIEDCPVLDVIHDGKRVKGVKTIHGDIQCDIVVNCAGIWARQLAAKSGVTVPLQAAEHYYLITEPIAAVKKSWPVLEDPGCHGYYREEGGGLMIGLFEPLCAPWKVGGIPSDFAFGEIQPDWDRMGPYVERAMSRVPLTLETGVKKFFCGPESFTPDLGPCLGEAPELRGYFMAAGLNSIGILTGGGVGRLLAHWILNGRPDMDVTAFNIDRLQTFQATPEYRRTRTVESLGMVYQCHYPYRSLMTARGAKQSVLHASLAAEGAYFKDVSGWEGADWYAGRGQTPDPGTLGWGRQPWWDAWEREHRAVRDGVILMDMSFMSKFIVEGEAAGARLNWLSTNDVDGEVGRVTYTQWLNDGGGIEADLTVTKLSAEKFMVIASDTCLRHVETWMRRHFEGSHAFVQDVTGGYAQLNIQGPKSRALLASLTSADLSDEAFPFRTARHIDIGLAQVLCVRITYLGELGYELYIPAEAAAHVYERIVAAGEAFGLVHAGLKALASCRMEKGYRDWGHDIDNMDDVISVGLGFAADLDKPGGFLGRDAVLAKKEQGTPKQRLVQVLLDVPDAYLFHAEPVLRDGVPVGYIRSASYGWTLGGAVGLAMVSGGDHPVTPKWLASGTWTVEVADRIVPARVSLKPFYDPQNARIKV